MIATLGPDRSAPIVACRARDRDSELVAPLFDERNEAVKRTIAQ